MEELMEQYREKFDDQFPLMLVQGLDDERIADLIRKCLISGKPYEPDLPPHCLA